MIKLQGKKYKILNSFIELLQKDLSLLKSQMQYEAPQTSLHEPTKPVVHSLSKLLDYAKDNFSLSKIGIALAGLLGSRGIYKYVIKQKKPKLVENDQEKESEQDEISDEPHTPKENFSRYYGPIPPEINDIFEQLETNDSRNKPLEKSLYILLGPGKKFLTKCLAGELKACFYSINCIDIAQTTLSNIAKITKTDPISVAKSLGSEGKEGEKVIQEIAKDLVQEIEKALQCGEKRTIIYLDQIDFIGPLHSKLQDKLLKTIKTD